MYIVDRNKAERAKYSSFEESVLREKSSRTLLILAPFAVLGVLFAGAALWSGASPWAFLLAGVFILALAASKN